MCTFHFIRLQNLSSVSSFLLNLFLFILFISSFFTFSFFFFLYFILSLYLSTISFICQLISVKFISIQFLCFFLFHFIFLLSLFHPFLFLFCHPSFWKRTFHSIGEKMRRQCKWTKKTFSPNPEITNSANFPPNVILRPI
jgi:uncharacterized membrane protein YesL